jgi:hypothetical protein
LKEDFKKIYFRKTVKNQKQKILEIKKSYTNVSVTKVSKEILENV